MSFKVFDSSNNTNTRWFAGGIVDIRFRGSAVFTITIQNINIHLQEL